MTVLIHFMSIFFQWKTNLWEHTKFLYTMSTSTQQCTYSNRRFSLYKTDQISGNINVPELNLNFFLNLSSFIIDFYCILIGNTDQIH